MGRAQRSLGTGRALICCCILHQLFLCSALALQIAAMMNTFIKRTGYPLVIVQEHKAPNNGKVCLLIAQSLF